MSKVDPIIAVPYFPGSNGDIDTIQRIEEFGMTPQPLYFHIGDEKRLEENAKILTEGVDGVVLCGGFPYEDRLGFGRVPSKIRSYTDALRQVVDDGKPVLAFCSGNQIAHAIGLAFPKDSGYNVRMLPNICDTDGELVYHGFLNTRVHTKLACSPARTAFTRNCQQNEVVEDLIAHGGGRFWADEKTLSYLLENGMIVTQYTNPDGKVIDNFPTNPNGSMLNIESITNTRGNLKIGMCHNERKISALRLGRNNYVFESMRDYILEGFPKLSSGKSQEHLRTNLKDFSYLSHELNPKKSLSIYIRMLTDDNERNTAELFLDEQLERRRLLKLELIQEPRAELMQEVVKHIADMDFLDGIMLKKDVPTVLSSDGCFSYEVVDRNKGTVQRGFREHFPLVEGFPYSEEFIDLPNPEGFDVREKLWTDPWLKEHVAHVHTGSAWFFEDEGVKKKALEELLD